MPYVKAKEAAKFFNIALPTIRKWARDGIIDSSRTIGGHYRYLIPNSKETEIKCTPKEEVCGNIIYARVSSRKQSHDLERQITFLQRRFPTYTIVHDIGSGINFKRPGFKTILEQLFKGNIKKVVVAHQDRFSRFSFDFFQWLFTYFNAVLESINKPNPESDMLEDIMEVFTVFTARYNGTKKHAGKTREAEGNDTKSEGSEGSEESDGSEKGAKRRKGSRNKERGVKSGEGSNKRKTNNKKSTYLSKPAAKKTI